MILGMFLNGRRTAIYSSGEKEWCIKKLEWMLEEMTNNKGTVYFSHEYCFKKQIREAEGTVRHRKRLFGLIDYYEIVGDDGKVVARFTIDDLFAAFIDRVGTVQGYEDEEVDG